MSSTSTSTAITQTNNHPFVFGIHTIMHNGYISDFAKIKRKMCEHMTQEAFEHVQGGTDTEHFAALFISFLCAPGDAEKPHSENDTAVPLSWEEYHSTAEIQKALQKTISTIIAIQNELLGPAAQPKKQTSVPQAYGPVEKADLSSGSKRSSRKNGRLFRRQSTQPKKADRFSASRRPN